MPRLASASRWRSDAHSGMGAAHDMVCMPPASACACTAVNRFQRTATLFLDDFSKIDYKSWTPSIGDGSDYGIPGEHSVVALAGWGAQHALAPHL